MAHLQWSSSLDTGIDVIDEQHKRIVQYINELYDAQVTLDKKAIGNVIEELVDYTISHFAFEESLMEQSGYPFVDPHKKVHELFIRKVTKFVERFQAGEEVSEELINMLQRWLINHIKNEDGDYADIVRASVNKMHREQGGWLSRSIGRFFG
jgi:hemerythrin